MVPNLSGRVRPKLTYASVTATGSSPDCQFPVPGVQYLSRSPALADAAQGGVQIRTQ